MRTPTSDGQVVEFDGANSGRRVPRIYYVNGIRCDGRDHARTATLLSLLTEHVVFGVYNATAGKQAGSVLDVLQCAADWSDVCLSKLAEIGNLAVSGLLTNLRDFVRRGRGHPAADPINVAESLRKRIPERHRRAIIEACVSTYNPATASLFKQLHSNLTQRQIIVAHSQGNLIAADALWSLVIALGETSLAQIRVYSLASPAPAWPLGLRKDFRGGGRLVYGHLNDPVTFFDPHNWPITGRVAGGQFARTPGDWRPYGDGEKPDLAGHDVTKNIALNFFKTVRRELGLPELSPAQLDALAQKAIALVS